MATCNFAFRFVKREKTALLITFLLLDILSVNCNEFYTAVAELPNLLQTQFAITEFLDRLLDDTSSNDDSELEDPLVQDLYFYHDHFVTLNNAAVTDPYVFVSNPINAFLLINSLVSDWQSVKDLLLSATQLDNVEDYSDTIASLFLTMEDNYNNKMRDIEALYPFPGKEDLDGSIEAIDRLVYIYQLNITEFVNGIVPLREEVTPEQMQVIKKSRVGLRSCDCYEIGKFLVTHRNNTKNNCASAPLFLEEALKKIEDMWVGQDEVETWLKVARRFCGPKTKAKSPDVRKEQMNFPNYLPHLPPTKEMFEEYEKLFDKIQLNVFSSLIYHALCRGDDLMPNFVKSRLKCFYRDMSSKPYFRLTRIKVEQNLLRPEVYTFHDVLSDSEVDLLKSYANLERASQQTVTGEKIYSDNRISKLTWIFDESSPQLQSIKRRIEAASALNMETSEELQLLNYGLGGHYVPHYDYLSVVDAQFEKQGNRISTWMFYLSDVEAGGATVFPYLNATVWPKKGSAIFWHNTNRNGTMDKLTLHAGCPVLFGSKWVANRWIHEHGQIFLRPCHTNRLL